MAVGLILICFGRRPGRINYDWQSAGPPGASEYIFWSFCNTSVCTGTLYCVLIARTQGPGAFKEKTQAKNKRQFSNPWRPKCSEGSCNGHEKRSGRCRALNATASVQRQCLTILSGCLAHTYLVVYAQKKRSELGICNYVELIDTIFTDVEGVD